MCNSKLILVAETPYKKKHDTFLQSVIDEGYQWFCVVGKDQQQWQKAMKALLASQPGLKPGARPGSGLAIANPGKKSIDELSDYARGLSEIDDSDPDIFYI